MYKYEAQRPSAVARRRKQALKENIKLVAQVVVVLPIIWITAVMFLCI